MFDHGRSFTCFIYHQRHRFFPFGKSPLASVLPCRLSKSNQVSWPGCAGREALGRKTTKRSANVQRSRHIARIADDLWTVACGHNVRVDSLAINSRHRRFLGPISKEDRWMLRLWWSAAGAIRRALAGRIGMVTGHSNHVVSIRLLSIRGLVVTATAAARPVDGAV